MTNFDHEVRERAGLARSARCKKASVKGPRGCSLPSDNLTAAQKKKLNGPVEVHRLDKPMTLAEFRTLPEDLQGNYIRLLQTEFSANDGMLGEMFGCSGSNVFLIRRNLGLPGLPKGKRVSLDALARWNGWLSGESIPVEAAEELTAETELPVECYETVEVDTAENTEEEDRNTTDIEMPAEHAVALNQLVLEITGKFCGNKLAGLLASLPIPDAEDVTVRIEVSRNKGGLA